MSVTFNNVETNQVDVTLTEETPSDKPTTVVDYGASQSSANALLAMTRISKAQPKVDAVALPTDPNDPETFIRNRYSITGELALPIRSVITNMNHYVKTMKPTAPLTPKQVGDEQRKLWYTFTMALNSSNEMATLCLDVILFMFEKHWLTVFNERTFFRGIQHANLSRQDATAFQFIGTLFCRTTEMMRNAPNGQKPTKRAIAATNLRVVVESLQSHQQQSNLTAYYTS